jgi:hypothetical protein
MMLPSSSSNFSSWRAGKSLYSYSGGDEPDSRFGQWSNRLFSSLPPRNFRNSNSINSLRRPSKSFQIHHSSINLSFDVIASISKASLNNCWETLYVRDFERTAFLLVATNGNTTAHRLVFIFNWWLIHNFERSFWGLQSRRPNYDEFKPEGLHEKGCAVFTCNSRSIWDSSSVFFIDPVRTSQGTHYVSATKPNRLILFRETIAVYCENHTEHTDTLCGQNI